jgi:hypothetical protein
LKDNKKFNESTSENKKYAENFEKLDCGAFTSAKNR